jgi:hypothetical protein
MKKRPIYKVLLTGIFLLYFLFPARAQLDGLGKVMSYQTENAQVLLKEYIRPLTNALGTDLSNGWYNTAKPHKTLGFDITFTLNTTFVPDVHKAFNPQDLELVGIRPESNSSPTALGDNDPGAKLVYEDDFGVLSEPREVASFELPKGTGMGFAPAPMLQAGVGIVKGTELIGRYTPDMQLGNQAEIGLWGVGIKHSIKQWIPVIKKLPVLHLSIMGGYTSLSSKTGLDFMPKEYVEEGFVNKSNVWNYSPSTDTYDNTYYDNQVMAMDISSFTANLLVSANLPVVCFYGGIGFNRVKSDLALNGNYPLVGLNENNNLPEITKASSKTDPINMEIKHQSGSRTNPRYNIGMRFKFAIITLHFDYTYSDYSVATAGLGISFR